MSGYSVGSVARLASVSVRTLHHYDSIGLLSPQGRTDAGYRMYSDSDLERLQQILFYRDLGFALDEITEIVQDPGTDTAAHFRRQHELLQARAQRLQQIINAVEFAMEADKMGINLTPEERFEVFGNNDPAQYADEASQQWGDTDAYQQSQKRTSKYSKADWAQMMAEQEEVNAAIAGVMEAGLPADSDRAKAAAEAHRLLIDKWFYDCSYEMQTNLAQMYVADPRFTKTYEDRSVGLAQYLHDAIVANALDKQ